MQMILYGKKRKTQNPTQPKKSSTWIINLISEVFATATISFLFAGLFIITPNKHILLDYLYNNVFIALYSGFIVIGIIFVLYIRWSADANPIISIYKTITGEETYLYCFVKIIAQTVGGIFAGLLVWLCTQSTIETAWNLNAKIPILHHGFLFAHTSFSKPAEFFFAASIEVIIGSILLWSIFSTVVNSKYKLLLALGFTTFATLLGTSAQIMNFNASRALAQDVGAIFKGEMGADQWITLGGIIFGTLSTPFILIFFQWSIGNYFNPWFIKAIKFKNIKGKIRIDFPNNIDEKRKRK